MKSTLTMKELPSEVQPYEKCGLYGPECLSDAELLAVILRAGTSGKTSLDLAGELLGRFRGRGGLAAVCHASASELMRTGGIGQVKAIQLRCIGELSRRIAREKTREQVELVKPASVARFFMEELRHKETEEVVTAFFNTKGRLISYRVISRGTVNLSVVTPREIFLEALRQQAVFVILLHNHPSGDPAPSPEDIRMTERVRAAGEELGIPLMDHIVIGDQSYVSFQESGLLHPNSCFGDRE